MKGRSTSATGAVLALFFASTQLACADPEIRACHQFVDALAECTDRNASGEHPADLCEEVHPDCKNFFRCAATRPCVQDPDAGFYTLDIAVCTLPEGVSCP